MSLSMALNDKGGGLFRDFEFFFVRARQTVARAGSEPSATKKSARERAPSCL